MTILDQVKEQFIASLRVALPDVEADASMIVRPPQREMGDLAFPCFALSKKMRTSPAAIATQIAEAMSPAGYIAGIEAAGPYVNIRLARGAFLRALVDEVLAKQSQFGTHEARGGRIMIEYGSPNTHKEIHVGHLRNFCLGSAVVNLSRAAGYDVVPVSYVGDIGAHVAKCLWGLKKFHAGAEPGEERGKFLGQVYADATKRVDENEAYKEEIAAVQRKLEARDPELTALWEETRRWSIDELEAIFSELGCAFERMYFESEVEEPGKLLARELLARGIAKEGERGALIVDLEPQGLGVFLILKSDGAALYSTKEIALAQKKFEDFSGITKSVTVVDNRQTLYFKQLFATLKLMGFDKDMSHLGYEFVTLAEGAMSSRSGNIVAYEDFRDEVIAHAKKETKSRRAEWSEEKLDETARVIAFGAMKFGMLKQDIEKPIVFDVAQSLAFEGVTGPYVQYAHARLSSILEKDAAGGRREETVAEDAAASAAAEHEAVMKAAEFPAVVAAAAEHCKPSLVAQYLFEFAQLTNGYYRDVPILSAPTEIRQARIKTITALRTVLANGLALLGMAAPNEM